MSAEQDLARAVTLALGRAGLTGSASVVAGQVRVQTPGGTVTVPVAAELAEWGQLSVRERDQLAQRIVVRVSAQRRDLASSAPARRGSGRLSSSVLAAIVGAALVGGGGFYYWKLEEAATLERLTPPTATLSYEQEREGRARRVCETTLSRVQRGTPVGPTDVEGWVTEIALLRVSEPRAPMLEEPQLAQYFESVKKESRTRLIWERAPKLAAIRSSSTAVILGGIAEPSTDQSARLGGAKISFTGRYVEPYFGGATQRKEFIELAQNLGTLLGADYGALYARCAHRESTHLGSWFRGPTPAAALVSMLYFVAVQSDASRLERRVLAPEERKSGVDHVFALEQLKQAVGEMTRVEVAKLISPFLGTLVESPEHGAAITFALDEPNRAARAARRIARKLGIAKPR